MQKIFTYGTLQDPEVQLRVLGRTVDGRPDKLQGFAISTIEIDGKTYPIAIPDAASLLEGKILEVADDDLPKLDEYETEAYVRKKVRLESGEEAWVYRQPE